MALIIILIVLITLALLVLQRKWRSERLFPGPRGIPFVGDLLTTPIYGAVFHFKNLTDQYGPLTETNLLGQRFLLVSSNKIAEQLLVGLGKSNSGRPCTFAVKDAQSKYGTAEYLPLMSFNTDHHRHKRVGRAWMTGAKSNNHQNHPVIEARRLMLGFLNLHGQSQTQWIRMTEDLTSRTISRIVFGSPVHAMRLHEETWQLLIWVSPNGVLPNLLPILDKIPSWLSPWKQREFQRHQRQQGWYREIYEDLREQTTNGEAPPCFMRDHILQANPNMSYDSEEDAIKAFGMIATAAVFTVSGPIQNVVRALACFPEWQPKLHEEMDVAVPFPQLPDLTDLTKLPLMRAFVRETTRWRQAIPSGIPHETEQDVHYEGKCIPAGTAIFPLEQGINRDPEVYRDPYDFNPMRWLDPESPNYRAPLTKYPTLEGTPMFGWGRRYCMGHELAIDEIYLFAMHLIWSFRVVATEPATFEKNLLPGEKKGGHQWPQRSEEALIIMRPEPVKIEFHERSGRGKVIREVKQ